MLIREKIVTVRTTMEYIDEICKSIQTVIKFKTEYRNNAGHMKQVIKQIVERGEQNTKEVRKLLGLLESLKDVNAMKHGMGLNRETPIDEKVPLEHEENTMKQEVLVYDSKLHENSNVNTSQQNPPTREVDESKEPEDIRYLDLEIYFSCTVPVYFKSCS